MFENKRAVKELIDYVLDEPNTIKAGKSENSVYLGKKDGTKIKDIVVDKSENKIIHANKRRMSADELKADGKDAHIPLHTDTKPAGATGANARSSANQSIIPQNKNLINPRLKTNLEAIQDDTNKFINTVFKGKISAQDIEKIDPKLFNYIKKFAKAYYEKEGKNIVEIEANNLTKQEKRGIYNVTYNGKFSTPVYKDLKDVDSAVRYAVGNKNKGAKHIEIKHLEDTTKEGYVTKQELLNMGENMRKFIKEHKEPFINDRKARLYEWEDDKGVRFRLVINDIKDKSGGSGIHSAITSTPTNDDIITFYSDRNLKELMKFENPKLKLLDAIDNSKDKVGVVKKVLLNKDISDGVKAKALQKALFDDAKFRPNTKGIIDAIDVGLKTKSQGGSMATSFGGKLVMAFVARSFERLAKHIPLIGKQAGKENLYKEAFLKAKTTSDALTDIMKNEAIPIKDRFDLLTKTQSKEIRSLIDEFIAKKEQVKSDLMKMDATNGEAKNTKIKGENFITKQSPDPKSDLNVKVSVDDWVRELGGINANKQIKADLTNLYEKHKELFAKPSDVFRLIKAVKENPTFFYNNNEPNTALIGKILDNGKLGKIGIQKEYDSEYLKLNHATHSSKADKENKRLLRRNEKSHLVGSPTPTQLTLGEATEPTADGAKALLDENSKDTGIIQTFIQQGSKSTNELGLPKEIIPKQTQELDKTFKK